MSLAVEPPRRFGAARVAERFGLTEGQVYTLAIGLVIGIATAAIGIPPTLRDDRKPSSAISTTRAPSDSSEDQPGGPSPATNEVVAPTAGSYGSPSFSGSSGVAPSQSISYGDDEVRSPSSGATNTGPAYADDGKLGDVEKVTTVGSPGAPSGIAADDDGGFFVVTDNGGTLGEPGPSKVLHYSATGSLTRTYTISGQPDDHGRGLSGVAFDGQGHLFVLDASTARVLRIDVASGAQTELAKLNDIPTCPPGQTAGCEPSLVSARPLPQGIAIASNGDLLVADAGQAIIWRIDRGGTSSVWAGSSEWVSPDVGPSGLAVDGDGSVLLVVSQTVMGFGGVVYRIPQGGDGKAGAPQRLFATDANTTPNGIAVGSSGRIYLAVTGSNALFVLDGNGAVVRQVTSAAFSQPFGLAWRGHSLLLTNQAPAAGDDPSSWSVLRLAAEDTAAR